MLKASAIEIANAFEALWARFHERAVTVGMNQAHRAEFDHLTRMAGPNHASRSHLKEW
jgi:hypothetical protein